jgi:hypothetical protein
MACEVHIINKYLLSDICQINAKLKNILPIPELNNIGHIEGFTR